MNQERLLLEKLLDGRAGLRVIGDIQGDYAPFRDAVFSARKQNLAVLCLGDITDRGPNSAEAIRIMLDLIERGDGAFIGGNHDYKFMRWTHGGAVEIANSGLATTIRDLNEAPDGDELREKFANACAEAPIWLHSGKEIFLHGAFEPGMLTDIEGPRLGNLPKKDPRVALAIYAETNGQFTEAGKPVRTYNWVETIPKGLSVYVGHDVRSMDSIIEHYGKDGGRAVFLDTGAGGKGGRLSWTDLDAKRLLDNLAIAKHLANGRKNSASPSRQDAAAAPRILLYIAVGPAGGGKTTLIKKKFPDTAVISVEAIRKEISGNGKLPATYSQAGDIARARIVSHLSRGEAVIVDDANLEAKTRKALACLAPDGTKTQYLVVDRPMAKKLSSAGDISETQKAFMAQQQDKFERRLSDILRGDGLSNVLTADYRDPEAIMAQRPGARSPKRQPPSR